MKNLILSAFIICSASVQAHSATTGGTRFHNESTDTIRINEMLLEAESAVGQASPEAKVAYIGKMLIGTPYKSGTLESDQEVLTVNLDEVDCTTYVDYVLAMAYTLEESCTSWRDFTYNLQRMRYRKGEINGYASRLHYISDWIVDNSYRGNLKEATSNFPAYEYQEKTLDFITSNKDKYPALKDSAEYERMRNAEIGYRRHRYPYIKTSRLSNKEIVKALKEGDVICITTRTPGLDVQHMGIVVKQDGIPYLMHASSAAGKVIIDALPLSDYLKKNRSANGIRVIRLNQ